jgi:hypothetical protein
MLCFSHGVVTGESNGRESVENSKAADHGLASVAITCRPVRTQSGSGRFIIHEMRNTTQIKLPASPENAIAEPNVGAGKQRERRPAVYARCQRQLTPAEE